MLLFFDALEIGSTKQKKGSKLPREIYNKLNSKLKFTSFTYILASSEGQRFSAYFKTAIQRFLFRSSEYQEYF